MKLSTVTAKLTSMKSNTVRILAVGALAVAAFTAAAPAAQAQRFYVGIGGPRYYAPAPPVVVYGGPAYGYGYGWRGHEDWRFHHDHFRGGYGYGRR